VEVFLVAIKMSVAAVLVRGGMSSAVPARDSAFPMCDASLIAQDFPCSISPQLFLSPVTYGLDPARSPKEFFLQVQDLLWRTASVRRQARRDVVRSTQM